MKAVLIGLVGIVGLSACDGGLLFGGCGDTVKAEALSPDGLLVATVFERDCGATTDFATLVNLQKADKPLDVSAETLILLVEGRVSVGVEWRADGTLFVSLPPPEMIFTKVVVWRGIRIVYE